ncbi:hypothetical protein TVNIR_3507 [Thioalkalivibrio nitratireducens DSM 14787]|uniref:Uncharacterized protein n=1 Tax=Thioalkalivibrio nitratireducens (strain DSM 14787 / UNIQEM 213 / ALEN2) TaxID=1255043 RepID=L0E3C5_THIND|nr:hypothetical protein TVNIR_3507 [Thioalkalivibrio nitratireducens DSM 14787]
MLVPLGGHREFVAAHGLMNDALAEALGLGEWVDPTGPEYDPRAVRLALRSLHAAAERSRKRATVPERLRANTARLRHDLRIGHARADHPAELGAADAGRHDEPVGRQPVRRGADSPD